MMINFLIVTLLFIVDASDVVITKDGAVRGIVEPSFRAFLGIPFAQPPIGGLRFAKPAPPRPWKIINATAWSPACPQMCDLPPCIFFFETAIQFSLFF